jgi:uncharacterized phage protein gp47/JayE
MAIDFSGMTAPNLQAQQLAQVPTTIDTREGSLIQTAIGPESVALAEAYANLDTIQKQAFATTAVGSNLDLIVAEVGITRYAASPAVMILVTDQPCALGIRFATDNGTSSLVFAVTDAIYSGPVGSPYNITTGYVYEVTCATAGSLGNLYTGNMIAVDYVANLTVAVMTNGDIYGTTAYYTPGTDAETDTALLARFINKINLQPFGGNVADYYLTITGQMPIMNPDGSTTRINGVGGCQIFPSYPSGGAVLCSIVDSGYLLGSTLTGLVAEVQSIVDPIPGKGHGIASIGAACTVVAATAVPVVIVANVTVGGGVSRAAITAAILANINAYLLTIQQAWDSTSIQAQYAYAPPLNPNANTIALSKIIAAINNVAGVVESGTNSVTINGAAADLVLTETPATQQFPIFGSFTPTYTGGV